MWVGIILSGETELVVLNRNVSGERYAELQKAHLPFSSRTFGGIANWILQDDNAPSHTLSELQDTVV